MNIPQLKIDLTFGQIGINYNKGYFDLKTHIPQTDINYNTDQPYRIIDEIAIDIKNPEMEIDFTEPWADLNVRKSTPFMKHIYNKGKEKTLSAISEIASEGDSLGRIEIRGNKIARLAKKELDDDKPRFKVGLLPEHKPDIKVIPGNIDVKVNPTKMKVSTNFEFPKANVQVDTADVYLKQRENIDIQVVGYNVDLEG